MFIAAFAAFARFRADLSTCHQPPSHEDQVAEREQGEDLGAVLGKAPISGLHMAELALADADCMFDLRPHHGDNSVDALVEGVKRVTPRRLCA